MVDVFEDVEEQLRTERYKALALKALPWVIGGAALALALTLGYWGWTSYQNKQGDKAAESYVEALRVYQDGDQTKAYAMLGEVAKSPVKAYRALALMQQAGIRLEADKTAEGVKLLDQAAEVATDPVIEDLARLKSALALLDTAPYKDLEARLTPLMEDKRPYRLEAREALAFAKLMAGKTAEARTDFVVLSSVLGATDGMQQRAAAAMGLIDAGSAGAIPAAVKLAATLPPPAPATPGVSSPAPSAPQAQQGTAQ